MLVRRVPLVMVVGDVVEAELPVNRYKRVGYVRDGARESGGFANYVPDGFTVRAVVLCFRIAQHETVFIAESENDIRACASRRGAAADGPPVSMHSAQPRVLQNAAQTVVDASARVEEHECRGNLERRQNNRDRRQANVDSSSGKHNGLCFCSR